MRGHCRSRSGFARVDQSITAEITRQWRDGAVAGSTPEAGSEDASSMLSRACRSSRSATELHLS